jgi:hypothetical protein
MRSWRSALLLALTAAASVVGYFALQVLAVFVAFFAYGSSALGGDKWVNVSALFVLLQLLIAGYLVYRKAGVVKIPALVLTLLITRGLFLSLDGSSLLAK